MTAHVSPVEASVCREDDGDMCLDIYLDKNNLASVSFNPSGSISWAGMIDGISQHSHVPPSELGLLLFKLIDKGADRD